MQEAGKDAGKALFFFFVAPILFVISLILAFTAPFILVLIVGGYFAVRHYVKKAMSNRDRANA